MRLKQTKLYRFSQVYEDHLVHSFSDSVVSCGDWWICFYQLIYQLSAINVCAMLCPARAWNIPRHPAARELDWWHCVMWHSVSVMTRVIMTCHSLDLPTAFTVSTVSEASATFRLISRLAVVRVVYMIKFRHTYWMFLLADHINNLRFLLWKSFMINIWRLCLQCFGWAAGRASGVVGCWCGCLSGARCRPAYGPADATATHCLLLQ